MSHACHSSRAGRCWRVRCIPTPHDPLHPPTPLKKAFGIQLPRGQMQTCNINPVFSASSFSVRWRHVTRQFFLASPLHLVTSLIKKLDEGECPCGKGPACFFVFFLMQDMLQYSISHVTWVQGLDEHAVTDHVLVPDTIQPHQLRINIFGDTCGCYELGKYFITHDGSSGDGKPIRRWSLIRPLEQAWKPLQTSRRSSHKPPCSRVIGWEISRRDMM